MALHDGAVSLTAFSPNGKLIVSYSIEDRHMLLWDAEVGDIVSWRLDANKTYQSLAFTSDGTRIVAMCSDTNNPWAEALFMDAETGEVVTASFGELLVDHMIFTVAFSPNGRYIVASNRDQIIRVWDTETGKVVSEFETLATCRATITCIALSPDGRKIACGGEQTIFVWDTQIGRVVLLLEEHIEYVSSVAFSPNGKLIASGSLDTTVCIWDGETGNIVSGPLDKHTSDVCAVAFSFDSTRMVSGSADNRIFIWDVETGDMLSGPFEGHTNVVTSVAFSPDGKRIVSGSQDKTIRVWHAEISEVASGIPEVERHFDKVLSVAFSPDSSHVISGHGDTTIRMWDAGTGRMVLAAAPPERHNNPMVRCLAFSLDGRCAVSGSTSADARLQVWDVKTGQKTLQGLHFSVSALGFSPDGKRQALQTKQSASAILTLA